MTTEATIGYGTVLQIQSDVDPMVFEDIGEVPDPGSLDVTVAAVDATHSRSEDASHEFIAGLATRQYSCSMHYVPGSAQHARLMAKLRVKTVFRLQHDNTTQTYWQFSAIMTQANHAMPLEDKKLLALTFQISGGVVIADLVP